ncbi:predicted protein [Scheffersomyces stipitis CBS 6054]|uniref:Pore and endoplasmic reticulum protein of 33 kDa n=1 Tax=Scheffersomyces stipitis (strain ATCC 58785 / CBS 6054 / NBRC 10063 / NRRL Y-11545) TaxID=322104 RepID=A3LR54_PICST|nr:predicted protein [Scheffersomyces stipitis CBS 6054]ABN65325.2 predicted protein [Scheffersomyces stipitis CBS 6054]KAG2734056.1 hypothetical protein G9P44_003581 [Scheffersomyces stipitis]
MAPPTRPTSAGARLQKLALTQQFYWFLGHVMAVLFFAVSTISSFIFPRSSLKYYRFSLLSILVTYVIVIKQIYLRKLSTVTATRLIRDENVQYFVLAGVFYLASFKIGVVAGSLYSFAIFAVFHILTYFQNNLLSIVLANPQAQQQVNATINQFTTNYNQQALIVAANAEAMLLVLNVFSVFSAFLFNLVLQRDIVYFLVKLWVAAITVVFVKFRFDSNQYTKLVIQQFDLKISELLARFNSTALNNLYNVSFKSQFLPHYIAPIQVPKENIKKT